MTSTGYRTTREQLTSLILLGVLAAALSLWSLDHVVKSACIYLQGAVFLFFMLILAQRSRLVAYALLPVILGGWFSYDGLYDVAGFCLQENCLSNVLTTIIYHQHYLRQTYAISVVSSLIIILKGGILYGGIYSARRFLKPVIFINPDATWLIAGGMAILFLLSLPLGILPHPEP